MHYYYTPNTVANIKLNKNVFKFLYKFVNRLFYFDNNKKNLRFCNLTIIKVEVF